MERSQLRGVRSASAAVALLLAAAVLGEPVASAHATLTGIEPADGSVLTQAPQRIVLTFDEAATLTALNIAAQNETPHRVGPLPGGASARFVIPIAKLPPGNYTLHYRVLSDDGHVVNGSVRFTLAPSAAR